MIKEHAYAKINLALEVVGKRQDGYHDLNMMMIPLELSDELTFENADQTSLSANIDIPNNAILKAVSAMKAAFSVNREVHINLTKRIPIGAGLGGGSADIAATLRGLNRLWGLNKELDELKEIALSLGSDTLFCLFNRPAYVHGRGEHIVFLEPLDIPSITLFIPNQVVSTKHVFDHHVVTQRTFEFNRLVEAYANHDLDTLVQEAYNDLETTTQRLYPNVKAAYLALSNVFPNLRMTGSGSAHFIISHQPLYHAHFEEVQRLGLNIIKTKSKN